MVYRFGDCELDDAAGELRRGGEVVSIQPKPLALLTLLIEERDRIVPNEELLERLWPGEAVTPNSLARAVSTARSAIGDSGSSQRIRAYRRRGYRFQDHVVELGAEAREEAAAGAHAAPTLDDGAPFLGRREALARLRAAWARSARGGGSLALLSGPAGIGKTCLAETFARDVAGQGGLVLRGRALEEEGEPAFWVWAQVLRDLREADPGSLDVPGLADSGELAALMPELHRDAPSAAASLPAEQRRFVFFDAVARALAAASRRRPLLIVFEDVQWADAASNRLLEHLAFELSASCVLLLATVRDEPSLDDVAARSLAAMRRRERFEALELEGLEVADVAELVAQRAGRALPELAERLHARTGGVPLFVREAVRRLADADELEDPEGGELSALPSDWVADALRSLSEPCRSLLGAAAVIGRRFPLPLVAEVAECSREDALDRLDEAGLAGLVEPEQEAPGRYGFVHDLFREAAYDALAHGTRVRLHQRVAEQLAQRHAGAPNAAISEIAHHRHRALAVGDAGQAFECAARAAELAFERRAYEQAALHWDQALAALDHFDCAEPELRLRSLLGVAEAARLAGERERRRRHFGEALALARELGRPEELAAAAIGLCDVAEWGVRDEGARHALVEALERLPEREGGREGELEARLLTRLGYLEALLERTRAEERLRRAVRIARELGASETLEEALYVLHLALGGPDDKAERDEILDELRGAAAAARDPVASVIAVLDVACDRLEGGDAPGAEALRREADTTSGSTPHPRTVWHRWVYDTGLALMQGRLHEVEGRAEEARALGRRLGHPYAIGCHNAHIAGLHLERGEPAEMLARFEPMLAASQGPIHWVKARVARGCVAVGRKDDAHTIFEQLAREGFERVPRNLRWTSTLAEIAHCAADLRDEKAVEALLLLLEPYEARHAVLPMVVCYGGPVAWALARCQEVRARVDEARALYEDALETATALGARPTQARIRLDLGRLLRRRGQSSDARAELSAAAALAADIGMPELERTAVQALEER